MNKVAGKLAATAPPRPAENDTGPARWAEARLVFPVYEAMAEQFHMGSAPCSRKDLWSDRPQAPVLRMTRGWFDQLDERTPVNQVRQLLQAHYAAAEENLRAFLLRLLRKPHKNAADRDKVDFVVVQYFAARAPQHIATREVTNAEVAQVLKPVLGEVLGIPPEGFEPLENVLDGVGRCQSLAALFDSKLLDQGRKLKDAAGEKFYQPKALVAFCRLNYLLRRSFIRLSHADLRATRDALCQLESCGVERIDCRDAGLSSSESIAELHDICRDWKHPFRSEFGEYSVYTALRRLIGLRSAAEAALIKAQTEVTAETEAAGGVAPAPRKPQQRISFVGRAASSVSFRSSMAPEERVASFTSGEGKTTLSTAKPSPGAPAAAAATVDPLEPAAVASPAVNDRDAAISKSAPPLPESAPPTGNSAPQPGANAALASTTAEEITEADIENCSEKIWEQLISVPPGRGRSMSTVTVDDAKLLLSSWEVAAYVSEGSAIAKDIRRAVVVRALLALALDARTNHGDTARLAAALSLAANEMNRLQGCVERAKSGKQTEGAVNLSMTAKRLLAFIEQAGDLRA
jgi:hypothetical protein